MGERISGRRASPGGLAGPGGPGRRGRRGHCGGAALFGDLR